jgi:hypothetical protein
MEEYLSSSSSIEIKLNYIPYDYLEPFPRDVNLLRLFREISTRLLEPPQSWVDTFYSINELRRIKKFYPELFNTIFDNLTTQFENFISHSKIPISKLSLILMSEVFSTFQFDNDFLPNWIYKLLPIVLLKTTSESTIIKQEAYIILNNVHENMLYPETVEVLMDEMLNKNMLISNISFECLLNLIKSFPPVTLEHSVEWDIFIKTICDLYENKKEGYVKKAFTLIHICESTFNNFYNCNYFKNNILSQIDDLEIHNRYERVLEGRDKYVTVKIKKEPIDKTRQSIKMDKRKSLTRQGGNNFYNQTDFVIYQSQRGGNFNIGVPQNNSFIIGVPQNNNFNIGVTQNNSFNMEFPVNNNFNIGVPGQNNNFSSLRLGENYFRNNENKNVVFNS